MKHATLSAHTITATATRLDSPNFALQSRIFRVLFPPVLSFKWQRRPWVESTVPGGFALRIVAIDAMMIYLGLCYT